MEDQESDLHRSFRLFVKCDKSDAELASAVATFKTLAEGGDASAMALYAHCLKEGWGVESRDKEASDTWASKARCQQKSFFATGYCYWYKLPFGDAGTYFEASYWLIKAADEQGDRCAMYVLGKVIGEMYMSSDNIIMKYWIKKSGF
jgi:TPR repeat protein